MRAFRHVDVFTRTPFSGNGLAVFPESAGLSTTQMQLITQEMRQFESIFLFATEDAHEVVARVFTVEEELDFAGHPVLGAACVLHERLAGAGEREVWRIRLNRSVAPVTTVRHAGLVQRDDGAGRADLWRGRLAGVTRRVRRRVEPDG